MIVDRPGEGHLHVIDDHAGERRGFGKVRVFKRRPATGANLRPIAGRLEHVDVAAAASGEGFDLFAVGRVVERNFVGVEIDEVLPRDHAEIVGDWRHVGIGLRRHDRVTLRRLRGFVGDARAARMPLGDC